MSVDRTDYIVYGWKLPFDIKNEKNEIIDLWDDKYRSMIEGHPGEEFTIIRDGMCAEYTVFGLSIDQTYDEWDFVELDIKKYDPKKLKNKYKEMFDNDCKTEPYLFIFSHFS